MYNPDDYPPPTYYGLQKYYADIRARGYSVINSGSLLLNALRKEAEANLQLKLPFYTGAQ